MVSQSVLNTSTILLITASVFLYYLRNRKTLQREIDTTNMKTIVVLGGSFAGVSTAHRILKKTPDVKITLVSPDTHIFWNLAGPRAIVPDGFADEKIFAPFAPGFKQYGDRYQFVLGTAESLDIQGKKVVVATPAGQSVVLEYDAVILATGSRTADDVPYKSKGSFEKTRDTLHEFQEKVKKAESIVIGGGGSTGVETAGEIAYQYGSTKKITLVTNSPTLLTTTPPSVQSTAQKQLTALKVDIILKTKVDSHQVLPSGQTELTLSSGDKLLTDLYLPTTGLVPNSSYVPDKLKNAGGYVLVDEYLHAQGTTDVWVVGDVSSVQRAQYVNTEKQATHVAKNIGLVLSGKPAVKYSTGGGDMLACPTGKKTGTGHFGSFKLPSFMVNMVKGKTYFTQNLPGIANGTAF